MAAPSRRSLKRAPAGGCRHIILDDEPRRTRARCIDCGWTGPWSTFRHTAERHRTAHRYVGRHRA